VWPLRPGAKTQELAVWVVDSGSTQHITGDKSQFVSYRKLAKMELIVGIRGRMLTAVGVGEVQILECKTIKGPCVMTLREVRRVPEAKANLLPCAEQRVQGKRLCSRERDAVS
jgi:hypothetical protein